MEILVIPQLDEGGTPTPGSNGSYRLLHRNVEGGQVILTDRALTRVETAFGEKQSIELIVPPLVKGQLRDFFVRIVATDDIPPDVTFIPPSGEKFEIENFDPEMFKLKKHFTTFALTEIDEGVFLVNAREADRMFTVIFDPCGGTVSEPSRKVASGGRIGTLPTATRELHAFKRWATEAEGGEAVGEGTVVNDDTTVYAQWYATDDPFREMICLTDNMQFVTTGPKVWTIDEAKKCGENASARSGAIADSCSTTLKGTFTGKGTLSYQRSVHSEQGYDFLTILIDGEQQERLSGTVEFAQRSFSIPRDGEHRIEFIYSKDGSGSVVDDCAWISSIRWIPEGGV